MIVFHEPGLCGLELWRGIARGVSLFELRERKEEYFAGLREFLVRLHLGEAEADDARETAALRHAAGFVRAILCGGEALHPLLAPSLRARWSGRPPTSRGALPFEIEIDNGGIYAARRGALRLFESMGWRRGVALDLGQLQLKVMTADAHWSVSRDESLLPFGAHAIDCARGRARLRDLLRQGLSPLEECPDGIVLALPVALTQQGVAQPATYPGLLGPVEPIFAELFECPWVVVNDAVLAAVGFQPRAREKTLVVTLGFGIGGALWYR